LYCWCILDRGTAVDPTEIRFEGINVILPGDVLFYHDLRPQNIKRKYHGVSKDRTYLNVEVETTFSLTWDLLPILHKLTGRTYDELVLTATENSVRETISKYDVEAFRSLSNVEFSETVRKAVESALKDRLDNLVPEERVAYADRVGKAIIIIDVLVTGMDRAPAVMR
jgi:hypothetical protein